MRTTHKGEYDHLHPNAHVNCSQSTNDANPTAIKLVVLLLLKDLLGTMEELKTALEAKAQEFADVLKMGRTENQDAVSMTLGQEFSAYAVMVESAAIAKEALKTGGSVYNLVLEKGWSTKENLDDILRLENMTDPREIPK